VAGVGAVGGGGGDWCGGGDGRGSGHCWVLPCLLGRCGVACGEGTKNRELRTKNGTQNPEHRAQNTQHRKQNIEHRTTNIEQRTCWQRACTLGEQHRSLAILAGVNFLPTDGRPWPPARHVRRCSASRARFSEWESRAAHRGPWPRSRAGVRQSCQRRPKGRQSNADGVGKVLAISLGNIARWQLLTSVIILPIRREALPPVAPTSSDRERYGCRL
jgi:hypothetical protein